MRAAPLEISDAMKPNRNPLLLLRVYQHTEAPDEHSGGKKLARRIPSVFHQTLKRVSLPSSLHRAFRFPVGTRRGNAKRILVRQPAPRRITWHQTCHFRKHVTSAAAELGGKTREIEPVRRSLRGRRGCTLAEVARLAPSRGSDPSRLHGSPPGVLLANSY